LFKKALIINTRTLLFPFPQVRTVVLLPGVLLALECFLFGLIDVRKKSSLGGGNHFLILGAVEIFLAILLFSCLKVIAWRWRNLGGIRSTEGM
jgi:hypothetical protein